MTVTSRNNVRSKMLKKDKNSLPRKIMIIATNQASLVEMERVQCAFYTIGWRSRMCCLFEKNQDHKSDHSQESSQNSEDTVFIKISDVKGGKYSYLKLILNCYKYIKKSPYSFGFPVIISALKIIKLHKILHWLVHRPSVRYEIMKENYAIVREKFIEQIDDYKPNAVIIPEDVVGLYYPTIVSLCQEQSIPVIIIPYTIANADEALRSLYMREDLALDWPENEKISLQYPHWVGHYEGKTFLRLPWFHILCHEENNITPPLPWVMNSGYANAIACESQKMKEYSLEAGLEEKKLYLVGSIYDDEIFRIRQNRDKLRKELFETYNLSPDKKIFLIGGCPDQSVKSPKKFDYKNMKVFCQLMGEALIPFKNKYNIVVRPHPSYPEMGEIFSKCGITNAQKDTTSLIALSDIYMAFASATIRSAIISCIPVINFDVFGYDYDDYKSVSTVAHVYDLQELIEKITECDLWETESQSYQNKLIENANYWGMNDGLCLNRIVNLVEDQILRMES